MCQNISSLNTNVYPLVIECNHKIIPTYSRTKKVRRTSAVCTCSSFSPSNVATNETDITTENAWKNHCQTKAKENSDSFIDCRANEQSDPCYKRMSTMNLNRSSSVSMNSIDQCHNDEEKHEVTEDIANCRDNHLEMSQHLRMISQQIRSNYTSGPGHRKVKGFGSTKISDCSLILVCLLILAINQVFAKPYVRTDMSGRSLEDILRSPCSESGPSNKNPPQVNRILEIIQKQTGIAKSKAKEGVERYIPAYQSIAWPKQNSKANTSKLEINDEQSVENFHKTWNSKEQSWLYPTGKELRKTFSEPIPIDIKNHFINAGRNLHMPTIIKLLQDCDERFQLLLIGFQTILDYYNANQSNIDLEKFNPLSHIFSDAKDNSRRVLCEIRAALNRFGATAPIIDPKNIESSRSDLFFYDWVIFREYINQLEHINEVVTVILENLA